MKRDRAEAGLEDEAEQQPEAERAPPQEAAQAAAQQEYDEDDDKPLMANYKMSRSMRKGAECPYLDTISRQVRLPPVACCCHSWLAANGASPAQRVQALCTAAGLLSGSLATASSCRVRHLRLLTAVLPAEPGFRFREVLLRDAERAQCVCVLGVWQVLPGAGPQHTSIHTCARGRAPHVHEGAAPARLLACVARCMYLFGVVELQVSQPSDIVAEG
jgi:hypothetical protein